MRLPHSMAAQLGVSLLRVACLIVCPVVALVPRLGNSASTHPGPAHAAVIGIGQRVRFPSHVLPGYRLDTTAVTSEKIKSGRKIFHGQGGCATCHGQKLEGTPVAPTLKAHAWKDAKGGDFDAIQSVVMHGVPGTVMVSHPGGISDAAAEQVAAYVWAVSRGNAQP